MLPVTEVVVFVTSARSTRALAANTGKMSVRRDANPWMVSNASAKSCKVDRKGFFSREISVKVNVFNNLALALVHYTSVNVFIG